MNRIFKQIGQDQRGQALVIVLAMLTFGGLTIVPVLNYTSTAVQNNSILQQDVKGAYDAEAGVESVIWSIGNHQAIPTSLSGPNGMTVTMQTIDLGVCTFYFGELIQMTGHYDYLTLSHTIEWQHDDIYKYTITVLPHGTPSTIFITGIGARLPPDYTYDPFSADDFESNLSRAEPQTVVDNQNAQMLNWQFPKVELGDGKTQEFYISGTDDIAGDYTWVLANRQDIGWVGELTGEFYTIIATATAPNGKVTAVITADVIDVAGSMEVISWQTAK